MRNGNQPNVRPSTFSIVAFDEATDELGVAVQSKFLAVGSVVPWAMANVGAIATQAWANTTYGPRALELLQAGHTPTQVVQIITSTDDHAAQRQLGIVDAQGASATYTGKECLDWAGGIARDGVAAQGNILAGPRVVEDMLSAFFATRGRLADRLVAAMRAAQAAGGDKRGKQSAALYIAKPDGGYAGLNDRFVDLRVDDHPDPIEELARILELHKLYFFEALPEDIIPLTPALRAEIKQLLVGHGMLSANSSDDSQIKAALVDYMHRENLENRVRTDGTIDRQTLEYLRAHRAK